MGRHGAVAGFEPDPSQITDVSGLVESLGRLRVWAGNPSLRALAKQVGPLLRPPRVLSHSTLAHTFQPGRRRLDLDLVLAIVRALGEDKAGIERWRSAWFRAHTEVGATAAGVRQLPADVGTFNGRGAELAALLGAVDAEPNRAERW